MNWRNFRWSIDIRSFNMWHEWAASLWKYCRALHRRFQVFMIQVFGTWDWWMITHYCPCYRKLLIPQGSASFHNSLSIINRLIHIPNKILGLRQRYRRRSDTNQWILLWISWIIITKYCIGRNKYIVIELSLWNFVFKKNYTARLSFDSIATSWPPRFSICRCYQKKNLLQK